MVDVEKPLKPSAAVWKWKKSQNFGSTRPLGPIRMSERTVEVGAHEAPDQLGLDPAILP
jgi:hypothetical protein